MCDITKPRPQESVLIGDQPWTYSSVDTEVRLDANGYIDYCKCSAGETVFFSCDNSSPSPAPLLSDSSDGPLAQSNLALVIAVAAGIVIVGSLLTFFIVRKQRQKRQQAMLQSLVVDV